MSRTSNQPGVIIEPRRRRSRLALLLSGAASLSVSLAGCGGGGAPTNHQMAFDVIWARRSRVISAPASALSGTVTFESAGKTYAFIVSRPDTADEVTQHVISPTVIPAGAGRFSLTFHAGAGGEGDVVGRAIADISLAADGSGVGNVATAGAVAAVNLPADQIAWVGRPTVLGVEVRSDQGALLAVSPGSVFWTITAGAERLSIESGAMTGKLRGEARLQATVDGKASEVARVLIRRTPRAFIATLPEIVGLMKASISYDGQVVVGGAMLNTEHARPFRWTDTAGYQWLPLPAGATDGLAVATSRDGSVTVGYTCDSDGNHPKTVLWRGSAAPTVLPMPDPRAESQPVGISGDGTTVAGWYTFTDDDGTDAQDNFVWSEAAGTRGLFYIEGGIDTSRFSRFAAAFSLDRMSLVDNLKIASPDSGSLKEGARRLMSDWTAWTRDMPWEQYLLGMPSAYPFFASDGAVSADGHVIGGVVRRSAPGVPGFVMPAIWSPTTGVLVVDPKQENDLRRDFARVNAVSPDGTMAGGGEPSPHTAFLWDSANGHRYLDVFCTLLDAQYGSKTWDALVAYAPSNITGFSGDNSRIIGAAGYGITSRLFVLDLP